jgi:Holliday junction DNA helicase RuvA
VIGSLRGTLLDRDPSSGEVLVEVGGVGYRAVVPVGTLGALGSIGASVFLHTHLHVREDALTLFGFATRDERQCFEALLGAHGVGPGLALAILGVHRPDALRSVVADDDVDSLCLVPGVGKKTAARLLLELKSRLDVPEGEVLVLPTVGPRNEVREALVALGYGPDEVRGAVQELPADGDTSLLLKEALTRLAR